MIENREDVGRTRKAFASGELLDERSYFNIAGHVFLRGVDRQKRRREVMARFMYCALCGKRVRPGDGDYEHAEGGSKHRRCDCLDQELADGTKHTNVRLTHGMWSAEPCHRRKHHREAS